MERFEGVGLVEPRVPGERRGRRRAAGRGAHQRPLGTVGYKAERYSLGAKCVGKTVRRAGVPRASACAWPCASPRARFGDEAEQAWRGVPVCVGAHEGEVCPKGGLVLGDRGGPRSWDVGAAHQFIAPTEEVRQHEPNKGVAGARAGIEAGAGVTKAADRALVKSRKTRRPSVVDDRGGKERPVRPQ